MLNRNPFWRSQPVFAPEAGGGSGDGASGAADSSLAATPTSPPASPGGDAAQVSGTTSTRVVAVDTSDEDFTTMGSNDDLDEMNSVVVPSEDTAPQGAQGAPSQGAASSPPAEAAQPPSAVQPPAGSAPQSAPPVPAAAAAQAAPPTPAQNGSQPAATAQPSPAGEPQGGEAAGGTLLEQMSQHRDALIGEIAAKQFSLTKEEADGLELDIMGTVPKLLAKVYFDSVTATLSHIQRTVPELIQQHLRVSQAAERAEGNFYKMFPALDRAKHGADVNQFATMLRGQPGMTQENLFALVGAAVMAKYGLTGVQTQGNGASAPASAPAVTRPSTPAFVPARPGVTVTTHPVDDNPFSGMGMEFDN